ncbi:class I SAM-dependent methyltransferase [Thermococcus aggregans]|uniref:Class I SAM-dependent methyltransferase n=1 Tax=Thermococcus aggregans TaxID=110163 RepID=A0A9E7MXB8_THEAG|nr:class I SAM-dependent methyltransferase [Thermococcus aggregans]USS40519.1 class I SAM-dependent methyltransferase [Thermococcus aggregans]
MPKTEPFEKFRERYEAWFERHRHAYLSELEAVRKLLPKEGKGAEIGVGTGRFAAPLGIKLGVEPSKAMAEIARKRGIEVIEGTAENLPFPDESLDYLLMVTTICFVDDPEKALREAYRVLKPGGALIIGFVDRNSPIGQEYERNKEKSVFYREARFFFTDELLELLKKVGFRKFEIVQTLFHRLDEIREVEPVKPGYGEGSFVVINAVK